MTIAQRGTEPSPHAFTLRYPQVGALGMESRPEMTLLNPNGWETFAGAAAVTVAAAGALWLVLRKRPTADEVERARRQFLVQSGRLVDGMLLDVYEMEAEDGRTLTMLLFSYRISGVDYECSQDITALRDILKVADIRAGFPCTVRYQPGNPQNSLVVAEGWTGLRERLPQLPVFEDPDPPDTSHLRPGIG